MFCQKCGNELKEEQTFCRICGEQKPNLKISIKKIDLVKRAGSFSLGVILAVGFILSFFFLLYKLNFRDGGAILFLLIMSLFSSGIISVLLMEMRKMKRKSEEKSVDKEIKSFPKPQRQIEEKHFIPAFWSVTDVTTENLLSTKKSISGEL